MKIIADTLGYKNILKFEPVRYETAKSSGYNDFDKFLTDRLNRTIGKNDTVLHLGDVAFGEGFNLAKKLNGKITLIKGNHDKDKYLEFYKSIGWDVIDDIRIDIEIDKWLLESLYYKYDKKTLPKTAALIAEINGKRVLFSHYPVFNDNPYDEKYKQITDLLREVYEICECEINIHGHTHSYTVNDNRCINACLEVNDFKPLEIEKILLQ